MDEDASSDEEEEQEDEPDEEELKEKRKRARNATKKATSKPAAKKAKATNGEPVRLAIRPAALKKRRKAKPQLQVADAESVGGLYAEVFAKNQSLDDAAAAWLSQFNDNEHEAMADLFNFVLKCAGCDIKITNHDVDDPDHFAEKLGDIQEEYQNQGVTDYPLIARNKGAHAFRESFAGIFKSLIHTMAKTNLLFDHESFMETLNAWVSTMTSAGNRPFRHTATVASLATTTALCEVGRELAEQSAKSLRQAEGEKKKSRVNKARVQEMEEAVKRAGAQKDQINDYITAWFDTVFIHRYRDVDAKIRTDCVKALGEWVRLFPDHFFDGPFLRYLGWVLSDTNKETRHEVVKALITLYKDKTMLGGLRTFTERFRARIVEMATNDSDPTIQVDAVLLLDLLRDAGFLEPDDIDAIGRLIFDSDARLRKAVIGFFNENIKDNYDMKFEELGGEEALEEILPSTADTENEEDFDSPRREWLKFKCLVEILQSYDAYDELEPGAVVQRPGTDTFVLIPERTESRFSLATESLYDCVPELKDWEVLSGYLLYDHTQSTSKKARAADPEAPFKEACKLDEKEEILLLEVLNTCVKIQLTRAVEASSDKKPKSTKAQKQVAQEMQEQAARHLALLIPRLLNKFGAVPEAASAVLRLEHALNLEIFEELRQDLTTYSALLDDIKKQFLSHGRPRVLEEASLALLHAKSYEDLEEVTADKLQDLWEDTINTFHAHCKDRDLTTRGNISDDILSDLSNTVLRIANLSSISDSAEYLEAPPMASRSKSQGSQARATGIQSVIALIERGVPNNEVEAETNAIEDELVLRAARVATFYFMWKVDEFKKLIAATGRVPFNSLELVSESRDNFVDALTTVLRARHGADELRLSLAELMIDIFTILDSLPDAKAARGKAQPAPQEDGEEDEEELTGDAYLALALEVPKKTQALLLQIFGATEKALAKRTKKKLEEVVDDEPQDLDEEPESDDEDDAINDQDESAQEAKLTQTILAEKRLYEFAGKLILGIWGGVLDGKKEGVIDPKTKMGMVETRLRRNAKNLGATFKSLIDKIEEGKPGAKKAKRAPAKGKGKAAAAAPKAKPAAKSVEIIESDLEDEDDPIEDEEELAREEEARRLEKEREEMMEVDDDVAEAGAVDDEPESVLGD
ncbi:STAG-domain-containing protein [Tothia fuscella]|uniref:STAG-domain-containing protein n=1 Tax=Tothia fuscella TaxID=1048955 RepID=A0A9P4TVE2_9PEZI|nr:STAG-domain-containing protein [Tothia fuscella]